jgi:OPA family glycerol-3-phosphate transporter-like MFS transporter/OPA family sugar phosphate sensor protein UhpC-like MFS transporter
VGLPELKGTKTALDNNDTTAEYKKFVKKRVFGNPVVWALAICDLFVYIVRFAVLDWGPKFLQQGETALSPQLAGWTIAIFEIAGCAGMLAAGWATDTLFKSKGQRMCLIEMFITALCLVGLWLLPKGHPVAMLVLLAVSGFFLYGPQALLGVVASNHVTKKAASSAVGLIGLMSYVSTIFTGFGVGLLSKTFGNGFWNNLFLIMAGVAVIGGLIVLPLITGLVLPGTSPRWLMSSTLAGGMATLRAKPPTESLAEPWALISPGTGIAVVLIYAAAGLGLAWSRLRRRDA